MTGTFHTELLRTELVDPNTNRPERLPSNTPAWGAAAQMRGTYTPSMWCIRIKVPDGGWQTYAFTNYDADYFATQPAQQAREVQMHGDVASVVWMGSREFIVNRLLNV